jgi:ferritin
MLIANVKKGDFATMNFMEKLTKNQINELSLFAQDNTKKNTRN